MASADRRAPARRAQVRGVAVASIAPFGASAMIDITVPGSSFVPESDYDKPYYAEVTDNYFT